MAISLRRRGATTILTGNSDDDVVLGELTDNGAIDTPRRWLHHLRFLDEASATGAAEELFAMGWNIEQLEAAPEPFLGWIVSAGRIDVLSPELVSEARATFESVTRSWHGHYGGWDSLPAPAGRHAAI